jgi:toxin ParE1/3/4
MKQYRLEFGADAARHLGELYEYIAESSSPNSAAAFTESIVSFCEGVAVAPMIGTSRDDVRSGLRTIGFKKRAVVAFVVRDDAVSVIGIYYGGREYESPLLQAIETTAFD